MPTTVVSSGVLPKSSNTVSEMIEQNLDYFGITTAGTLKKNFGIKEAVIIGGSIILIVFLVKKVV